MLGLDVKVLEVETWLARPGGEVEEVCACDDMREGVSTERGEAGRGRGREDEQRPMAITSFLSESSSATTQRA